MTHTLYLYKQNLAYRNIKSFCIPIHFHASVYTHIHLHHLHTRQKLFFPSSPRRPVEKVKSTSRSLLIRARHKKAMDQIEQNQTALREDLDSMRGNIDELNRSIEQIMCALTKILARQDRERKAPLKETIHAETNGILVDGNPLLWFIPHYKNGKAYLTQPETNLPPPEGLIPPSMKNGIPHVLQIPLINPPTNDDFMIWVRNTERKI